MKWHLLGQSLGDLQNSGGSGALVTGYEKQRPRSAQCERAALKLQANKYESSDYLENSSCLHFTFFHAEYQCKKHKPLTSLNQLISSGKWGRKSVLQNLSRKQLKIIYLLENHRKKDLTLLK